MGSVLSASDLNGRASRLPIGLVQAALARPGRRPPPRRSAYRRPAEQARARTAGADARPSATDSLPAKRAGPGSSRPSARPGLILRDLRALEQVSTRSPRPQRPARVPRLAALGRRQAGQFGEPAGDQGRVSAAAEPAPFDHAAGYGQHVLDRAADLRPDQVVGQIGAEGRGRDGLGQGRAARPPSAQARVTAVGRPRPPRRRSSDPTARQPRPAGATSAGPPRSSSSASPARSPWRRAPPAGRRRKSRPKRWSGSARKCWAGARPAPGRRRRGRRESPVARDRRRPALHPGRKSGLAWSRGDRLARLRLARPQLYAKARAGADLGQGRAPGPGADHPDAGESGAHALAPLRPGLWVGLVQGGGLVQRPARPADRVQPVGQAQRQARRAARAIMAPLSVQ